MADAQQVQQLQDQIAALTQENEDMRLLLTSSTEVVKMLVKQPSVAAAIVFKHARVAIPPMEEVSGARLDTMANNMGVDRDIIHAANNQVIADYPRYGQPAAIAEAAAAGLPPPAPQPTKRVPQPNKRKLMGKEVQNKTVTVDARSAKLMQNTIRSCMDFADHSLATTRNKQVTNRDAKLNSMDRFNYLAQNVVEALEPPAKRPKTAWKGSLDRHPRSDRR